MRVGQGCRSLVRPLAHAGACKRRESTYAREQEGAYIGSSRGHGGTSASPRGSPLQPPFLLSPVFLLCLSVYELILLDFYDITYPHLAPARSL